MTVARKPGHRGERAISRKTIARGMPDVSGVTVVTTLVCSFYFACEAAGASRARHSLRPHIGANGSCTTRALSAPREQVCHARTPVPDLIGDDPGIRQSSQRVFRRGWITGSSPVMTISRLIGCLKFESEAFY